VDCNYNFALERSDDQVAVTDLILSVCCALRVRPADSSADGPFSRSALPRNWRTTGLARTQLRADSAAWSVRDGAHRRARDDASLITGLTSPVYNPLTGYSPSVGSPRVRVAGIQVVQSVAAIPSRGRVPASAALPNVAHTQVLATLPIHLAETITVVSPASFVVSGRGAFCKSARLLSRPVLVLSGPSSNLIQ